MVPLGKKLAVAGIEPTNSPPGSSKTKCHWSNVQVQSKNKSYVISFKAENDGLKKEAFKKFAAIRKLAEA